MLFRSVIGTDKSVSFRQIAKAVYSDMRTLPLEAREELEADGIATRVVSMPCWELFDRQPPEYRDQVLPRAVTARVAVEQASTLGWDRYVGDGGAVIGMHTFGASAPLKDVLKKFGFDAEHVVAAAKELLGK